MTLADLSLALSRIFAPPIPLPHLPLAFAVPRTLFLPLALMLPRTTISSTFLLSLEFLRTQLPLLLIRRTGI